MTSVSLARHSIHLSRKPATVLAAAVVGLALSISTGSTSAAEDTNAWAAGLKNLTPAQGKTFLKIARDLFQHEELSDSNYTACIDPFDSAASDPAAKAATEEALNMVQDGTRRMGYTAYVDITDEYERVRLAKNLADIRWLRNFKKSVEQCLREQGK
jgi:hypothetical protein